MILNKKINYRKHMHISIKNLVISIYALLNSSVFKTSSKIWK